MTYKDIPKKMSLFNKCLIDTRRERERERERERMRERVYLVCVIISSGNQTISLVVTPSSRWETSLTTGKEFIQ